MKVNLMVQTQKLEEKIHQSDSFLMSSFTGEEEWSFKSPDGMENEIHQPFTYLLRSLPDSAVLGVRVGAGGAGVLSIQLDSDRLQCRLRTIGAGC
ncbi:unnamed protein product [Boreogadus saida]